MKSYSPSKGMRLSRLMPKQNAMLNPDALFRELEQAKKRFHAAQQKYTNAYRKAMALRYRDDPYCEEVLCQFDNRNEFIED